jgi:RNA polymerase sigma-70 factor (ECF subfamily)
MPDQHLIKSFQLRENGSLEKVLQRYKPLILYIITPILPNLEDREECFSNVAMRLWRGIHTFDPQKSSFTTWLTTVTRNEALTYARLKKPEDLPLPEDAVLPEDDPEQLLLQKERQKAVQTALRRLSERDRILVYRRYYYCQSISQIAAELGATERSVEGRLYRIRRKLERYLKGVLL